MKTVIKLLTTIKLQTKISTTYTFLLRPERQMPVRGELFLFSKLMIEKRLITKSITIYKMIEITEIEEIIGRKSECFFSATSPPPWSG